jgi:carbonic anhydrase
MKRRTILRIGLAGLLSGSLTKFSAAAGTTVTAEQALQKLKEGNQRYIAGMKTGGSGRSGERRDQVAESQSPYAIILGCADSRVAPEVLFDTGIGDLFVVRVAGNIVSNANYGIMGSVEFGHLVLGAPLIVVLGHSSCGAVQGALDTIAKDGELPGSIEGVVDSIRPAARRSKGQPGDPLVNATRVNVQEGIKRLPRYSEILQQSSASGKLKIVGGVYDLRSGAVEFL